MRITIKQLKQMEACDDAIVWLKKQNNRSIRTLVTKATNEGHFDWVLWYAKRVLTKPQAIQLSIFSARLCLHDFEKVYPNDDRPRKAIEAAEAWLKNPAESAAESVAESAAESAWSAAESARFAARYDARYAARYAAESVTWPTMYAARYAARYAAESVAESARSAAESVTEKEISGEVIKILGF